MGCVTLSMVACRSSMHSSRLDWVLGEARLISSASTMLAKMGPGRNSNSPLFWLKTLTPVTSLGSRSGVNWTRANRQSMDRASDLASSVLPDAREVLDDDVAAGQQGHDAGPDDLFLAQDDRGDVRRDTVGAPGYLLQLAVLRRGAARVHLHRLVLLSRSLASRLWWCSGAGRSRPAGAIASAPAQANVPVRARADAS